MKNYLLFLLIFIGNFVIAQEKPLVKKDTIKTEVINVITSYAPKVTDAFKIKKQPIIKHSKNTEKKALEYTIFSVPVASTFIPKSGAMKTIDLGERERLYNNYASIGLGNQTTPFIEAYVLQNSNYDSEYGAYVKFLLSLDPVENTKLSSTYYNANVNLFYKQEEHYFTWKTGLHVERNKYNWYGLPSNIPFTDGTIEAIEEEQTYKSYRIFGNVKFDDSYIDEGKLAITYFSDILESSEFHVDFNADLKFPLERIHRNLEDLSLHVSSDFLGGKFARSYENNSEVTYSFFTFGLNPTYNFLYDDFHVKLGLKGYFSLDIQNSATNFLVYPDVEISYPIIKDFANLYIGASGDLHTNTYKKFADQNPYVSPTLNITQTNEAYNFFGGFRGKLAQDVSYNVKGSYKNEEDKPLFSINNSKSNGIRTGSNAGFLFYGYEYGNSFNVVYDDVKTISIFGEVEYNIFKNLTIGANGQFNKFTSTSQQHAWNLPEIEGELFAKYKTKKWYANANIFFVGNRKDVVYDGVFPSISKPLDLKSYIDINFNGGYHFNEYFSAFLNLNNVLNNSYERYTNFNTQGFHVLGGVTYKFDF